MKIILCLVGLISTIYEVSIVLILYDLIITYFLLSILYSFIKNEHTNFLDFLLFNLISLSGFIFSIEFNSNLLLCIVSSFGIMYIILYIYKNIKRE